MSSLLFPVGPERPSVYWLRRLVLIGAVGMLLLGVWFLVGDRGGGSDAESTQPTVQASAASATEASGDSAGSEVPAASPAALEPSSEVAVSGEPIECGDEVILVDSTSDSSTYRVGTNPVLTLTITNTGDLPCLRDVGPKANEIEVTSGGYHVWSSDDCNASDKTKTVTLQPGETVSSSITWSGVLSRKGCPDIKREAKAGRYEVVGRNGKVRSDGTPFALTQD